MSFHKRQRSARKLGADASSRASEKSGQMGVSGVAFGFVDDGVRQRFEPPIGIEGERVFAPQLGRPIETRDGDVEPFAGFDLNLIDALAIAKLDRRG